MSVALLVILGVAALLLILYLVVPRAMLRHAEKHMVFQPPPVHDPHYEIAYGENVSEFMIPVKEDGTPPMRYKVHVAFFPAINSTKNQQLPCKDTTVIYSHGNGYDLTLQDGIVDFYTSRGINLLLFDYPGYGKSESKPSYRSLEASVLAVYDWYVANRREPGERIIAHGMSLGGAAACYLAANRPLDGLVLEATFVSVASALTSGVRYSLFADALRNDLCLSRVPPSLPVLIVHGSQDEVLNMANSERLYKALMSNSRRTERNSRLFIIRNGTHFNLRKSPEFWNEWKRLFCR